MINQMIRRLENDKNLISLSNRRKYAPPGALEKAGKKTSEAGELSPVFSSYFLLLF